MEFKDLSLEEFNQKFYMWLDELKSDALILETFREGFRAMLHYWLLKTAKTIKKKEKIGNKLIEDLTTHIGLCTAEVGGNTARIDKYSKFLAKKIVEVCSLAGEDINIEVEIERLEKKLALLEKKRRSIHG